MKIQLLSSVNTLDPHGKHLIIGVKSIISLTLAFVSYRILNLNWGLDILLISLFSVQYSTGTTIIKRIITGFITTIAIIIVSLIVVNINDYYTIILITALTILTIYIYTADIHHVAHILFITLFAIINVGLLDYIDISSIDMSISMLIGYLCAVVASIIVPRTTSEFFINSLPRTTSYNIGVLINKIYQFEYHCNYQELSIRHKTIIYNCIADIEKNINGMRIHHKQIKYANLAQDIMVNLNIISHWKYIKIGGSHSFPNKFFEFIPHSLISNKIGIADTPPSINTSNYGDDDALKTIITNTINKVNKYIKLIERENEKQ